MTSARYPGSMYGSRPKARKAPAKASAPAIATWSFTREQLAQRDAQVAAAATAAAKDATDASWAAYLPSRDAAVLKAARQQGADFAIAELRRTGHLKGPRRGRLLGSSETTVRELIEGEPS